MADVITHEHDVVIIGAGGAGLRAAIEASAAGVSVAMICKSMLGKAHTVMAKEVLLLLWPTRTIVTLGKLTSVTP